MLFVDASVAVAILAGEDDAGELMQRLEQHDGPFYVSAVVRMEASLSLTRRMAEATGRAGPLRPTCSLRREEWSISSLPTLKPRKQ